MFKLFQKKDASDMWLLVGLGNPGDKYARNRHNIGFMAIDAIADECGFPSFRSKFQGQFSAGAVHGSKVVLLKPQTMMNLSGDSVQKCAKFYKIAPERIVIFHDEIDIEFQKVKVKLGGGNAGHNGLKSVQKCLGTPDYWRVRLGVGHPGDKSRVHGHVLSDFAKAEQEPLERMIGAVVNQVELLTQGNADDYMSRVAEELKE